MDVRTVKDERPPFSGLGKRELNEIFPDLTTPCYVIDERLIERNCKLLASVINNTGCRILLAQKAFSNYDFYPVMSKYLSGTEASGIYEARLGKEKMPGGEVHVFCAAYRDEDFDELLKYADHIVFNSVNQLEKFGKRAKKSGKSVGLRINPECSTQEGHAIYDPCAPGSRLGVTRAQWNAHMTAELTGLLDGLHFHTLCEQDSNALEVTLEAVENRFGDILTGMKWLNLGGGHHITRPGYDIPRLERLITRTAHKYDITIYLEPGEACALNAGYLVTTVVDLVKNGDISVAVLDASAACHMPDVIEMPYIPPLYGADGEGKGEYVYRLAGPTCLAGDVIGDYVFPCGLNIGDRLVFGDMAIYTTCKNNTFNGMPLPDIYKINSNGDIEKLTNFGYDDFKRRLGSRS